MDLFKQKLKRWNEHETAGLVEIRARLFSLLKNRPQFPEVVGDRKLLRFLKDDHSIKYSGLKVAKEFENINVSSPFIFVIS